MKKLTLDIDQLQVQSFTTIGSRSARGTVAGQVSGMVTVCSCASQCTCETGCYATCEGEGATCEITCDNEESCRVGCDTGDIGCGASLEYSDCCANTAPKCTSPEPCASGYC